MTGLLDLDYSAAAPPPVSDRPTLDAVQGRAIDEVFTRIDGGKHSTILAMATGTGKTWTSVRAAKRYIAERGKRVLFLVHRSELIEQAEAEFRAAGISVAVEQAERRALDQVYSPMFGTVDVVIGSKDTMQGGRLDEWPRDAFGLVIPDECHLSKADTWSNVLNRFGDAFVLGLSASPFRLDGQPLYGHPSAPFEDVAFRYTINEAIANGHLSRMIVRTLNTGVDLRDIRGTKGKAVDFNRGDIEDRLSPLISTLVDEFIRQMDTLGIQQAILFTPDVATADGFASVFRQMGVPAAGVWGAGNRKHPLSTEEKKARIQMYREGRLRVLASCDLLIEGFNHKPSHVLLATITKSLGRQLQRVGRGTRIADLLERIVRDGVPTKYVIDCNWMNVPGYVPATDVFILDEPDTKVRQMAQRLARARKSVCPTELVEEARELLAKEEARRAETLRLRAEKPKASKATVVDFTPVSAEQILGLPPAQRRDSSAPHVPPTPGQVNLLNEYGMKGSEKLSQERAEILSVECLNRTLFGLTDPRQILQLVRRGVPEAEARTMKGSHAASILSKPQPATDKQIAWLVKQGYRPNVASAMSRDDYTRVFLSITRKGR